MKWSKPWGTLKDSGYKNPERTDGKNTAEMFCARTCVIVADFSPLGCKTISSPADSLQCFERSRRIIVYFFSYSLNNWVSINNLTVYSEPKQNFTCGKKQLNSQHGKNSSPNNERNWCIFIIFSALMFQTLLLYYCKPIYSDHGCQTQHK